ncbi:MAG: uncharacterized protein QOD39_5620 [Mycobacterium sp.]|nr:uncharacterized protein [Mycobacterium sp.]
MTALTTSARQDWLLDPALAPAVEGDVIRPLYDAAARGELVLPFCADCELPLELEQRTCDGCGGAERVWRQVDPRGSVHTATMMHRREPGLVRATDPYLIVDVEMGSGHRIVMTTLTPTDAMPRIGTPVRIGFRRLGDIAIPAVSPEDQ